jgi:16S rRNA (uracil1498-N3)-methyltransferase
VRITRVHHRGPLAPQTRVELGEKASGHLSRVLRIAAGDPLVVFDGEGGEFPARVVQVGRRLIVELTEPTAVDRQSPLALTLLQGIARGDHMDVAIQKATELGVSRIVPVITARTQGNRNRTQLDKRRRHWQGVIVSACEQCGRNRLPVLESPRELAAALATESASASLRLALDPAGSVSLGELQDRPASIALLVGPEGGLTEPELDQAISTGFRALRLGPRVLRTETAAMAAIAVLQERWGDL